MGPLDLKSTCTCKIDQDPSYTQPPFPDFKSRVPHSAGGYSKRKQPGTNTDPNYEGIMDHDCKRSRVPSEIHLRKSAEKFLKEMSLDIQDIQEKKVPFSRINDMIALPSVIKAVEEWMTYLFEVGNYGEDGLPLITGNLETGVYLAAYVILPYPEEVFRVSILGDIELNVVKTSKELIVSMHETARLIEAGNGWEKTRNMNGANTFKSLCLYLGAFKMWRVAHLHKNIETLNNTIVKLQESIDEIRQENQYSEFLPKLEEQMEKSQSALSEIRNLLSGSSSFENAAVVVSKNYDYPASTKTQKGSGGMSNEQLAHELLIDPNFRLDDKVFSVPLCILCKSLC